MSIFMAKSRLDLIVSILCHQEASICLVRFPNSLASGSWHSWLLGTQLSSGAWLAFVVLTIVNPTPMNWKLLSRPNQFSLVTIGFDLYRIFGTFWNIELSNPWVGCCIFWSIQLFLLCISCHTYHISFYTILLHISWWYGITYRPIEIYLYHPHDISEPS